MTHLLRSANVGDMETKTCPGFPSAKTGRCSACSAPNGTPCQPTPTHRLPTSCHVCGAAVPNREGATRPDCWHDWTNAEALAMANAHDRQTQGALPSMTAIETLDPREAVAR